MPYRNGEAPAEIAAAPAQIRQFRALDWKEKWCSRNTTREKLASIADAPEPTDAQLDWSGNMLSVYWDTGYLTITAEAFQKLPAAKRNQIMKLGGLK